MTLTGNMVPGEPNFETGPNYPVVFGVTLTPMISGLLLALAGLAGAAYLFLNFVQPEWQKYQELDAKVKDQEAQLQEKAKIEQSIKDAQAKLAAAKKQQQDVLSLFANENTLNTILLDINRQVDDRNADLAERRKNKLAACPAWVRNNTRQIEDQVGDLAVKAQLRKFVPDPKVSGIITDGSYGSQVNNKLKRQVANVSFEGNFNQTQSILRSLERLQPLLIFRNVDFALGGDANRPPARLFEIRGDTVQFLPNCQPEAKIVTSFQLEAPLPLTPEDMKKIAPPPAAPPAAK